MTLSVKTKAEVASFVQGDIDRCTDARLSDLEARVESLESLILFATDVVDRLTATLLGLHHQGAA